MAEEITDSYPILLQSIADLLTEARRRAARNVNTIMTTTYWHIGRHIVEHEQGGEKRAEYGAELLKCLSADLTAKFGRGFGESQIKNMRQFYLLYTSVQIRQSVIGESGQGRNTLLPAVSAGAFPLPWTHYTRLLRVSDANTRAFYETEALRGGWSARQLDRQIQSQFYERCLLSRNKAATLQEGMQSQAGDALTPEQEIKDPTVLEFLDLKDQYSESDLEDAIILRLQEFLMEMGPAFTFVDRQRRLRIGNEWYRIDLLLYHRILRCLVIIDLKIGKFDHADAGQMITYVNYADVHWRLEGENPPVGLILCAEHDRALAQYTLAGKEGQVLATEYRLNLPDEETLRTKLIEAQRAATHSIRTENEDDEF